MVAALAKFRRKGPISRAIKGGSSKILRTARNPSPGGVRFTPKHKADTTQIVDRRL